MKSKLLFLMFVFFSYAFATAQSISSITPATGIAGNLINVTITGQSTNFQQGTDIIKLTSGSTVISPRQSTFTSPDSIQSVFAFNKDNPVGYYNLSIQKNGSYNLNLNNGFYLNADPSIASINSIAPVSAHQAETITLTINGLNSNFGNGGLPTTVWMQQGSHLINGTNIVVINPLTIQASFVFTYAHIVGNYDVCFYNALDGNVTQTGSFTLLPGLQVPSLVSCTPNSGTQCEFLTVSISGQNTQFQQGTDVISLTNGSTVLSPQQSVFVNDSLIQSMFVFTSLHPTGYYNLSVQKWNSYNLSLNNGFYLNPVSAVPSLVSVSPSSGIHNTVATLNIIAANTHFGQSGTTTTAYIKQGNYVMNQTSCSVIDSNHLQVQLTLSPSYPTGIYNLYVTNTLDGSLVLVGSYTINPGVNTPMITSVSPNTAMPGQTLTVSITGQNTLFEQGTDNVNLSRNGNVVVYPSNVAFISPLIINATFYIPPTLPTGFCDVNATGNDAITLTNGFEIVPFSCSAMFTLIPDSAVQHHYFVLNNASGTPPLDYLWSWGDGTFDSIAYPSHTYSTTGNYTICLTITDSTGCTSNYCDSSNIQKSGNSIISLEVIPGTTGISSIEIEVPILVYPNPVTDILTIECPRNGTIEILNLNGQILESVLSKNKKTSIDLSKFPSGIYITKVKTDKGIAFKKIFKL